MGTNYIKRFMDDNGIEVGQTIKIFGDVSLYKFNADYVLEFFNSGSVAFSTLTSLLNGENIIDTDYLKQQKEKQRYENLKEFAEIKKECLIQPEKCFNCKYHRYYNTPVCTADNRVTDEGFTTNKDIDLDIFLTEALKLIDEKINAE